MSERPYSMAKWAAYPSLLVMLSGCVDPAPFTAAAAKKETAHTVPRGCDPAKAQFIIGRTATPRQIEEARLAAGAGSARVLFPGQEITLEYLASRLSIGLDRGGIVTQLRCG